MFPVAAAMSLAAATMITAAPASAATVGATTSANWAGYAASGQSFQKVSGSWTQPAASCTDGAGDAAFWVGLGGASQDSQALEQAGTEVDCSSGQPVYSAWYELVPAAPVKFDGLSVSPGDKITATVGVDGNQVAISLKNDTTGQSASKDLRMDNPDTSSAEWIAEAPSECQGGSTSNCTPVPLADFGSVDFTNATATANNLTAPISQWEDQAMQLSPGSGFQFASDGADLGAAPSDIASDGSSFSVVTQSTGAQEPSDNGYGDGGWSDGGYGYPGYGYGWGAY